MTSDSARHPGRPRRRVAIAITPTMHQALQLIQGGIEYSGLHGGWMIHTHPRSGFASLTSVEAFDGDGIIAHVGSRDLEARLAALPIPVVNVSSLLHPPRLPSVRMDNHAIGRLAVEHFVQRGFRQLAFCGLPEHGYSLLRGEAFAAAAQARRATFHPHATAALPNPNAVGGTRYYELEQEMLCDWLSSLPRPLGLFACNDMRARVVLDACTRLGVRVPEDVAILGVDDDPILCPTAEPPLSSIAIPFDRIGYQAAAMLDRLMHGEPPDDTDLLIPPMGVMARRSSDSLAIEDEVVAAAASFIREHACDGIGVEDVMETLILSRRSLERRFRSALGHSLHDEILQARVDTARRLLATTEAPMSQVAARAGFASAERFSVIFRRLTGMTPTDHRRQYRQT